MLGRIISYFQLLPFSFLKDCLFALHISTSIFPFPKPGFQLCLLQLRFLSPPWSLPFLCLPVSCPLGRWRSDEELASSQEQLFAHQQSQMKFSGAQYECTLPCCPRKCVSKPHQDCCHSNNCKHTHEHTPWARLPLTASSTWIWGLSAGYFNWTSFQPQASSSLLQQLLAVVSMQAVTSKALAQLLLCYWVREGFLQQQAGSTVGCCRRRLCPTRRAAWLCFQTTTEMWSQAE